VIELEDLVLHKVKISVLWLFATVAEVVGVVLATMEPGFLQNFMDTGELNGMKVGPEVLLVLAVLFLVMLVMAFLSLTLNDKANRWTNIIVATVFLALTIPDLLGYLTWEKAYVALITSSVIVAKGLIIWYAYKWPKQKE
jgi:preprotein translocase subunit Sec61beta